jgi:hypothetical protein
MAFLKKFSQIMLVIIFLAITAFLIITKPFPSLNEPTKDSKAVVQSNTPPTEASTPVNAAAPTNESSKRSDAAEVEPSMVSDPESFLGVKFNATLDESGIDNECEGYSNNRESQPCFTQAKDDQYGWADVDLGGLPDLGFAYRPRVGTLDSKVAEITIEVDYDYEKLKAAMIAKFGSPTTTESLIFTTNDGRQYDDERLRWIGKNVRIVLSEAVTNISTSVATIWYVPLDEIHDARVNADNAKTANSAASKM